MNFLSSTALADRLRFALDARRQTEGGRLVLTLLDVEQIMGEGSLGPEGAEEGRRIKRPARRRADEDKGAWELASGVYWITLNERFDVPDGGAILLQPHPDLLRNGVWHPTVLVRDWDADAQGLLLVVGARGVRLTEGAAVSVGHALG